MKKNLEQETVYPTKIVFVVYSRTAYIHLLPTGDVHVLRKNISFFGQPITEVNDLVEILSEGSIICQTFAHNNNRTIRDSHARIVLLFVYLFMFICLCTKYLIILAKHFAISKKSSTFVPD